MQTNFRVGSTPSRQATYMIEINIDFMKPGGRLTITRGFAAGSTTFHERNQDIQIGCMNKLLARMQDWKRQFDESCEVAPRQGIEIRRLATS